MKLYTNGSLFKIRYQGNDYEHITKKTFMLIQVLGNTYIFVDVNTGNRWKDEVIIGTKNDDGEYGVTESMIKAYFHNDLEPFVEYLGNMNDGNFIITKSL